MEVINRILDVVLSTQFIATFTASAMAFFGVYLTLRRGQKTHEMNLAAEYQKRRDQREFEAKKEVFANLCEAITRYSNSLGQLPDVGYFPDGELGKSMREFGVNINKLMLYACNDTIRVTMECSAILAKAYVSVLEARMPIVPIENEIKAIDAGNSARHSWIESLDKGTDRELIKSLWAEITDKESRKKDLVRQRYEVVEMCRDKYMEWFPALSKSQMPVVIALRKELGFDIDEESYKALMSGHLNDALAFFGEAVGRGRATANPDLQVGAEERN